ncbi:MAG: hypothetical protein IT464_05150 [Planctomycetes bacterium]|nr:hypothetical protein [Planctomycetota bacterium]
MRYTLPWIAVLLAACGSQQRPPEEDDPWENHEPRAKYYDHDYKPPGRRTSADLVKRAAEAEAEGRDDQARVDYHQLFRGDRWHVQGNTRYQDLMLRNGLDMSLWQEYLDLWEANPARGDALWFHLRPAIVKRQDQEVPTRGKPLTPEQLAVLAGVLTDAAAKDEAGDSAGAMQAIESALEQNDWVELHRMRIALCTEAALPGLAKEYADRADDDPSDGNALSLYALAIARTDMARALRILRDGYILDLPGQWLYRSLAEICAALGDSTSRTSVDSRRQAAGWYRTAEALLAYVAEVGEVTEAQSHVQGQLAALEQAGVDSQS